MGLRASVRVDGVGARLIFSQIEEVLGEFGLETEDAAPPATQVSENEWSGRVEGDVPLAVAVSVSVALVPFFRTLASRAGEDVYAALKRLVRRALTVEEDRVPEEADGLEPGATGKVTFRDTQAPVEFALDLELPDAAFRRLAEIDWSEIVRLKPTWQGSVKLRWDPSDEEWWIALFNRPAPLAGAVIELNESNFQTQVIEADKPVVVHTWSASAAASEAFTALVEELAHERDDLRVARLNPDQSPALGVRYGVFPRGETLLLFQHGRVAHGIINAYSKRELTREIELGLSLAVREVGEWNFQTEVIEAERPVLVHFWAAWAPPSLQLAAVLESLARERDDLRVTKLNIDENQGLTQRFGIMSVPFLMLFEDGEPKAMAVGAQSRRALEKSLGLD